MSVRITTDLSDVQRKLGILPEHLQAALLEGIAEGLFAMTRGSFEQQQSPEGQRWAPVSPRYSIVKARMFPGRNILYARGGLFRSLYREVQGNRAVVGSNLPYASAHQLGLTGVVRVAAHRRRVSGKDRQVRAHSRQANLPARPFLPKPETAEQEAKRLGEEIIQAAIDKVDGGE